VTVPVRDNHHTFLPAAIEIRPTAQTEEQNRFQRMLRGRLLCSLRGIDETN